MGTALVWNLACALLGTRDVLRQSKKFPGATAWWDFDGKICRSGRAASADSSLPGIVMFCLSSPWLRPLVLHIQPYPFITPKALLLGKKNPFKYKFILAEGLQYGPMYPQSTSLKPDMLLFLSKAQKLGTQAHVHFRGCCDLSISKHRFFLGKILPKVPFEIWKRKWMRREKMGWVQSKNLDFEKLGTWKTDIC